MDNRNSVDINLESDNSNKLKNISYTFDKNIKSKDKPNYFRIGVYGRTSAGKTCYLAALAMKRTLSWDGSHCTWNPIPDEIVRKYVGSDPKILNEFEEGRKLLLKATQAISKGNLPPPTPHSFHRLIFSFINSHGAKFFIEMMDYSGELVDVSLSREQKAEKLRNILSTVDGFVVLTEAPRKNIPIENFHAELHQLELALIQLTDECTEKKKTNVPIVMIVNKWDRQSNISSNDSATEKNKLEIFIKNRPEPPHAGLASLLEKLCEKDNFLLSPASAFGKCHTDSDQYNGEVGNEKPVHVNPLRSFGLEYPFSWIVERVRTKRIEKINKKYSKKSILAALNIFSLINNKKYINEDNKVFNKGSDTESINNILKNINISFTKTIIFYIVVSYLCLNGIFFILDKSKLNFILKSSQDIYTNITFLEKNLFWLKNHNNASCIYRFLSCQFLKKQDIDNVTEIYSVSINSILKRKSIGDDRDYLLATAYLKYFKNKKDSSIYAKNRLIEKNDREIYNKIIELYNRFSYGDAADDIVLLINRYKELDAPIMIDNVNKIKSYVSSASNQASYKLQVLGISHRDPDNVFMSYGNRKHKIKVSLNNKVIFSEIYEPEGDTNTYTDLNLVKIIDNVNIHKNLTVHVSVSVFDFFGGESQNPGSNQFSFIPYSKPNMNEEIHLKSRDGYGSKVIIKINLINEKPLISTWSIYNG